AFIPSDLVPSRHFTAAHAGVCAWTGMVIRPHDQVRYYDGALIGCRWTSAWGFGTAEGGFASQYERVGDVDAMLARMLCGTSIYVMNNEGKVSKYSVRKQTFVGVLGKGEKTVKQMRAILT